MEKNPYQIIRTNYPSYSKVFRVIADYILNDPEEVLKTNIHQLGRDLNIAESSIVRFCKSIGYSGFSELKIMLAKYGRQSSKIIFENLKDGSPEATSRDIFSLSIETLQIAAEQLDFSAIKKTADMLSKAERVVICGVGASASVAESFAAHLLRIGITAEASTDSELMQLIARAANEHTLFIAITKSGRNLPLVHAFELAKEHGAKVILNPAPYQKVSDEFLSKIFLVTPNENEAEEMTGVPVTDLASASRAAKVFYDKGVENVLITLGSRGVFVSSEGREEIIPAFRVDAVDTTGAGDAFNGGLLTALAEGKSLWDAAVFGNALAALSVQKMGTSPAMPTRQEIDDFLRQQI